MTFELNVNGLIDRMAIGAAAIFGISKFMDWMEERKSEVDKAGTSTELKLADNPWQNMSESIDALTKAIDCARPSTVFSGYQEVRKACKQIVDYLNQLKSTCYSFESFSGIMGKIDALNTNDDVGKKILRIFYSNFNYMYLGNFSSFEALKSNIRQFNSSSTQDSALTEELKLAKKKFTAAQKKFYETAQEYNNKFDICLRLNLISKISDGIKDSSDYTIAYNGEQLQNYQLNKSTDSVSILRNRFILFAVLTAYIVVTHALREGRVKFFGITSHMNRNSNCPNIMKNATLERNISAIQTLRLDELNSIRRILPLASFYGRTKSNSYSSDRAQEAQTNSSVSSTVDNLPEDPESDYVKAAWQFLECVLKSCPTFKKIHLNQNEIPDFMETLDENKLKNSSWLRYILNKSNKKYLHEQELRTQIEKFEKKIMDDCKQYVENFQWNWPCMQKVLFGEISGIKLVETLNKLRESVKSCDQEVKTEFGKLRVATDQYSCYASVITKEQCKICQGVSDYKYVFYNQTGYEGIFEKICDCKKLESSIEEAGKCWQSMQKNALQKLGLASQELQNEYNKSNVSTDGGKDSTARNTRKVAGNMNINFDENFKKLESELHNLNRTNFCNECKQLIEKVCNKVYNKSVEKLGSGSKLTLSGILCRAVAVCCVYILALNLYIRVYPIFFNWKCNDLVNNSIPEDFGEKQSSTDGQGRMIVGSNPVTQNEPPAKEPVCKKTSGNGTAEKAVSTNINGNPSKSVALTTGLF